MKFSTTLPLKTVSALNVREHWAKRAKRVKAERQAAAWVIPPNFPLPCVVTLTRLSSGILDKHDNLRSSFKGIVDGIADRLSVHDNDPRIEFRYAQEKVKRKDYGVRIELEAISC